MNKVVSRFQISNSLVETVQDVMNNNSKLKSFDERNNTVNLYENRLPIDLAINHSDKIAREHARKWAYHNKEMTSLVNNRHLPDHYRAHEYAKHSKQATWYHEQYNARLDQLEAKKTTVNESFAGGLVGAGIGAGVGLGMSALGADPSIAIPGYSIPGYFLGAYNPWSRNVSYDEHHTKSKEEHDLLRDRLINRGWKIYDQSSMANSSWRVQDYYNRNNASGNQVPTIASIKNDPLHKTTLLFKGSNIATGRSVALKAIKYPKDSINEKITSDMSVQDIIRDFVHSNDKRFRGKTKKQRIQMALGAYYSMHPSKKKNLEEGKIHRVAAGMMLGAAIPMAYDLVNMGIGASDFLKPFQHQGFLNWDLDYNKIAQDTAKTFSLKNEFQMAGSTALGGLAGYFSDKFGGKKTQKNIYKIGNRVKFPILRQRNPDTGEYPTGTGKIVDHIYTQIPGDSNSRLVLKIKPDKHYGNDFIHMGIDRIEMHNKGN